MHFLENIRRWVGALAELGISIIALGVVLQVLFGDGTGAVPFLPVDVLGSVIGFGLLELVFSVAIIFSQLG